MNHAAGFGDIPSSSLPKILRTIPKWRKLHSDGGQWIVKPWVCQRCNSQRIFHVKARKPIYFSGNEKCRSLKSVRPQRRSYIQTRRLSSESYDGPEKQRSDLPSQEEGRRSHLSKRFSHLMDHLQSNIFIAGQRLNDLTGYSGIEALKKDIEQQGPQIPYWRPHT